MEFDTNYLAVLVAGIAWFGLGAFWYSKVGFGKSWMAIMGFSEEEMKSSMTGGKGAKMMGLGLLGALVTACVLSYFVALSGAADIPGALKLAFFIWLGFIAPIQLGAFLWERKPIKLFVINTAYAFVSLSTMTMILALWR